MSQTIETLKRAIGASGKTRYRLSIESGIAQSVLSRLMSGEQGISIDAAERLADALGLQIEVTPKRPKRGRSR